MYNQAALLLLHAVSSIHAGSGSEVGLVDLPVQREKHTGYPKLESSSLKGAVRAVVSESLAGRDSDGLLDIVFGKEGEIGQNNASAGAIALSDARILLFPVRSLRGVFGWLTCPMVLNRFNDEMRIFMPEADPLKVPTCNTVSSGQLIVNQNADIKQVVLEEYTYEVSLDPLCTELAGQLNDLIFTGMNNGFRERLMVVSDNDFADFVTLSTEVNARIRIDSVTGTVANGALWYEENVPPETVFYSYCFAGKSRVPGIDKTAADVMAFLQDEANFPPVFQLGGNSTLGRGILRRVWKWKRG